MQVRFYSMSRREEPSTVNLVSMVVLETMALLHPVRYRHSYLVAGVDLLQAERRVFRELKYNVDKRLFSFICLASICKRFYSPSAWAGRRYHIFVCIAINILRHRSFYFFIDLLLACMVPLPTPSTDFQSLHKTMKNIEVLCEHMASIILMHGETDVTHGDVIGQGQPNFLATSGFMLLRSLLKKF